MSRDRIPVPDHSPTGCGCAGTWPGSVGTHGRDREAEEVTAAKEAEQSAMEDANG